LFHTNHSTDVHVKSDFMYYGPQREVRGCLGHAKNACSGTPEGYL